MSESWRKVLAVGISLFLLLVVTSPIRAFVIPRSGAAAPWSTQLSVAQQKAAEIDRDAVLEQVEASIEGVPQVEQTTSSTLLVRFGFIRPSGGHIWVRLADTNPEGSVLVEHVYDSPADKPLKPILPADWGVDNTHIRTHIYDSELGTPPQGYLERLRKNFAGVRVSPREAFEQVTRKARPYLAKGHKLTISRIVFADTIAAHKYDPDVPRASRVSPWREVVLSERVWAVFGTVADASIGSLVNTEVAYPVDSQTGEVMERHFHPPFDESMPLTLLSQP